MSRRNSMIPTGQAMLNELANCLRNYNPKAVRSWVKTNIRRKYRRKWWRDLRKVMNVSDRERKRWMKVISPPDQLGIEFARLEGDAVYRCGIFQYSVTSANSDPISADCIGDIKDYGWFALNLRSFTMDGKAKWEEKYAPGTIDFSITSQYNLLTRHRENMLMR